MNSLLSVSFWTFDWTFVSSCKVQKILALGTGGLHVIQLHDRDTAKCLLQLNQTGYCRLLTPTQTWTWNCGCSTSTTRSSELISGSESFKTTDWKQRNWKTAVYWCVLNNVFEEAVAQYERWMKPSFVYGRGWWIRLCKIWVELNWLPTSEYRS